jgi:uncharacterized SAM-binding protein YcdF (DUF218 family)
MADANQPPSAMPQGLAPLGPAAHRPVIVIYGAAVRPDGSPSTAMRRRVRSAYSFGRHQADPLYIPTGGIGRFGASEASVMARILRGLDVPEENILLEDTGISTLTSVLAVDGILRVLGHRGPVYAASSAYHLPRCMLLMLLSGMDAWACPARASPASRIFRKRWYWRLREAIALPVDVLVMLAKGRISAKRR